MEWVPLELEDIRHRRGHAPGGRARGSACTATDVTVLDHRLDVAHLLGMSWQRWLVRESLCATKRAIEEEVDDCSHRRNLCCRRAWVRSALPVFWPIIPIPISCSRSARVAGCLSARGGRPPDERSSAAARTDDGVGEEDPPKARGSVCEHRVQITIHVDVGANV